MYEIKQVDVESAKQICAWKYSSPYDLYNMNDSFLELAMNLENHCHAIFFQENLVGFFWWGIHTRVFGHSYCDRYVDVDLRMNPAFVGKGYGKKYVQTILDFLKTEMQIVKVRCTVVAVNQSALEIFQKLGFDDHYEFENPQNKMLYKIMRKELS